MIEALAKISTKNGQRAERSRIFKDNFMSPYPSTR
jgi:hypothetical protein